MVTARQAYGQVREMLNKAGVEDAGFDADLLFTRVAGTSRLLVDELTDTQWEALLALAKRRAAREPLQYILGSWAFLELELAVGPGVLAPRPETEEVCLAAAELLQGCVAPAILDLCSGTGALALGLQARFPTAGVAAVEWSEAAFAYLVQNVAAFSAQHPHAPRAVRADAFTYHKALAGESLDLVVSNPPYVTAEEYEGLAPEVRAEPKQALVAEEGGLAFYRAIARDYRAALKPGGWLVFEIGAGQGTALRAILAENGYGGIEIRPDFAGLDRIALAQK